MTLQQLEYIIALDNYRHFVTAAEKTFVTQPTLTMQVKKLEDEIGVQIFDRSKKPLKPTKAGEAILLKARQILREVNQLKEFVSTEKSTLQGTFRLGIIPTLAPYLLPLFIRDFTQNNPNARLAIKEMQSEAIINGLNNDTLDLGILVTPLNEKTLREIPLFYEPFLLYLPEDHPLKKQKNISANQLIQKGLLLLDEGHCFRNQMLNICSKKILDNKSGFDYQSGSIEALKQLVKTGQGYTLVPELSLTTKEDEKYAVRFSPDEPVREVSLVVHKGFSKELLIDHLQESIMDNIPKSFTKGKKHIRVEWR